MATRLPSAVAAYAVGGIGLVLDYVGPRLLGTEWYYMGFGLGAFIGAYGWKAYARMTEAEKKDVKWHQNEIVLVIVTLLLIGLLVILATIH